MKQKPGICVVPIVVIGALSSFIIYYQTQNSRLAAALLALTALGGIHAYLQFRRQQAEFVEMLQVQQASMSALVDLAQLRDEEVTGRHLNRLGFYAAILTKELGLPPDLQENIAKTIALHDIGKVAVPDYILNKPGPLNQEEWALIQQHPLTGASVLDSITADINVSNTKIADYLTIAREIALNHHEKWDGSGYPQGLSGEDIPLSARIAAVCDVYDSLRSARPYKRSFSHREAVEIIRSGRGTHFDPHLVDAFERLAPRFASIWDTHGE